MYDNGMLWRAAPARCMPADPRPVGANDDTPSLKEILM
jgi:hypothetical protein